MDEFINAVQNYSFLQRALVMGVLASLACGVIGSYVVVRRIGYIAGGIAHCVLAGLGAARYLQTVYGWAGCRPIYGAVLAALAAAVIIGVVSLKAKQREDTVIGALWAAGMAVGILFISKTPGYSPHLMGYLFGNIMMVSPRDLFVVAGLDVVVLFVGLIFYKQLLAVCFDEEFARLRGVRVDFFYLLLLCLTALTVVLLSAVVGVILVIALLTLPVAVAGIFAKRLWQMMILAVVFSVVFTAGGLAASYSPNLPPGATIIIVAASFYLLAIVAKGLMKTRRSKRPAHPPAIESVAPREDGDS